MRLKMQHGEMRGAMAVKLVTGADSATIADLIQGSEYATN